MKFKFPLTVAQKQKALYVRPLPPEELSAWGDRYQDAGFLHDALEFYTVAKNSEALRKLALVAMERREALLFLNAFKALGEPPPGEQVKALYEGALAAGKLSEAGHLEKILSPEA